MRACDAFLFSHSIKNNAKMKPLAETEKYFN